MMKGAIVILIAAYPFTRAIAQFGSARDTMSAPYDTISVPVDTALAVQDSTWKLGGYGFLQFNQATFIHWAAGGWNALTATASGYVFANKTKGDHFWNSFARMDYGITKQQYTRSPRKSVDLMELQTKVGHDLGKKFFLTGLVNFRSQFSNGYAYPNDSIPNSRFLAPGYLALSVGIDWKPTNSLSVYFSPLSSKLTIVADQKIADMVVGGSGLWGNLPAVYDSQGSLVTHADPVRFEYGIALITAFYGDIGENVTLGTKLQIYENHLITEPEQIDVVWDFLMNMKVNKWLTASISATLIYDQDIPITDLNADGSVKLDENGNVSQGPRVQFNESLGIGLMYRFGHEVQ